MQSTTASSVTTHHLVSYPRGGHLSAFTTGKAPTGLACVLFPCLFSYPGFSHLNKRITQQCGPPKARSARSETEETDSIFPPFWHWLLFLLFSIFLISRHQAAFFWRYPIPVRRRTQLSDKHTRFHLFPWLPVSCFEDGWTRRSISRPDTNFSRHNRTLATIDDHQRRQTTMSHRLDAARLTFFLRQRALYERTFRPGRTLEILQPGLDSNNGITLRMVGHTHHSRPRLKRHQECRRGRHWSVNKNDAVASPPCGD